MNRGRWLIIAGLALSTTSAARAAESGAAAAPSAVPAEGPMVRLTLEEAIRLALANNPGLQSVQDLQRQARGRIGEARAAAGPSVNATGTYTRTGPISEFEFAGAPGQPPRRIRIGSPQSRVADVSATYRPDLSGRTGASVRIARAGAEAAEATTATTINDLTFQVQNAYYSALRDDELVEVRRQAVTAAQEQLRVANAKFRAGTVPQFDVLRASVQVENLRQNQTVAETNARVANANLVNVLGIDPATRVELAPVATRAPDTVIPPPPGAAPTAAPAPGQPSPSGAPPGSPAASTPATAPSAAPMRAAAPAAAAPLPTTETAAFAEAERLRPEVQQARENVRQNQARISFERRARMPELAITGAYQFTPDASGLASQDHSWRVGASLSLDVFDAGLIRSRVRQAEAGRDSAEALLDRTRKQVALEVRTALLNLREAEERRQTTAANVEQAREALRISQVRYNAGVATNVEVTDAQVALTEAQTNQVNADYDYLDAQAALTRALGRYAPPTAGRAAPPAPVRKR